MLHIQDLSPIFKSSLNTQSNNTNTNLNLNPNINGSQNLSHKFAGSNTFNNPLLTPSSYTNTNYINNHSNGNNQSIDDKPMLTYTNFYKFCCLKNVNCYFYQFNTTATSSSNASTSIYEVLRYEKLIKNKLKNDYHINDIITWIAKKELCLFQLQVDNPNEAFDPNIGFNQLKDAMSNIISENKLSLKLLSATTFDANKIYDTNSNNLHVSQTQQQKKSMNVVYLSFLKAVHKFILHKMTKSHLLFEASNQSLSIEIFPYSGQLLASSMIQKTSIKVPLKNSENNSKRKKILKKLVPYSIMKLNPSLNQKNELIVNITSLKKMFYRLTDYITVSCNSDFEELDKKSKFALYIAPSGIRCVIAGADYQESITDELPENSENLLNVLKTFNDIDLISNPSLINDKRYWVKIHPCGFNSSNSTPIIADYLNDAISTGKKYVYWPLDLCFIQLPSDSTIDLNISEPSQQNNISIDDPFQIVDDFLDIVDEVEIKHASRNSSMHNNISPAKMALGDTNIIDNPKAEFRFPDNFNFNTEIDSIDQQLKPLADSEMDGLTEIMKSNNEFDNLFNEKNMNINLDLENFDKNSDDVFFQKQLSNVFDYNSVIPKSEYDNDFVNGNTETKSGLDAINQVDDEHKTNEQENNNVAESIKKINEIDADEKNVDSNFDEDWDDLFGESFGEDGSVEKENENNDTASQETNQNDNIEQAIDSAMNDLENEINLENNPLSGGTEATTNEDNTKEEKQQIFNPEKESTSNSPVASTSPFYQDPGAPSPIPFQIFAPEDSPKESNPPSSGSQTKPNPLLTPKESKKSIFSPLNFNPLIEKDIDSKYSNGGKFFVRSFSTGVDDNDSKTKPSLNLTGDSKGINHSDSLNTPSFIYPGRNNEMGLENLSNVLSDSDEEDEIDFQADQKDDKNKMVGGETDHKGMPFKNTINNTNDLENHSISESGKSDNIVSNDANSFTSRNIFDFSPLGIGKDIVSNNRNNLFLDLPENDKINGILYDLDDTAKNADIGALFDNDLNQKYGNRGDGTNYNDDDDDDDDDEDDDDDDNNDDYDADYAEDSSDKNKATTEENSHEFYKDSIDLNNRGRKQKKGRDSIADISTQLLGKEGNLAKRRKLETIFANIGQDAEDDELDLDSGEDEVTEGYSNIGYKRNDLEGEEHNFERGNDNYNDDIVGLSSYDIVSTYHKDDIGANLVTSRDNDEELPEMTNIDIPNSWFYVLRLISPIQIPFNYLGSTNLTIDKTKLDSLLPILQEFVLYSQKQMKNSLLNMLIQNRECPTVLEDDLEYLLYKIFPKINKVHFHELIDSHTESNCEKPFECLFDIPPTDTHKHIDNSQVKSEIVPKFFHDNNYEFSPLINVPPGDSQILDDTANDVMLLDSFNQEFQKLSITNSISDDYMFRIKTTNLNMKRFDENIAVNKFALEFWKILNLEPYSEKKIFKVLLVIPGASSHFNESAQHFLLTLVQFYKNFNLGEIEFLNDTGILNIFTETKGPDEYWNAILKQLLSTVEVAHSVHSFDKPESILLMICDPFQDLQSILKMAEVSEAFRKAIISKSLSETVDNKKKKRKKNKTIASLPIKVFYKSFAIETLYSRNNQIIVFTNEDYTKLAFELYNNCPSNQNLKDRSNVFLIEKEVQNTVDFKLHKNPRSKSLTDDQMFLHLCYERSVDKKWCVASWVDQSGSLNFTKSWYIDEQIPGCEGFEKVADDIMKITMDYVKGLSIETFVVLTRLNNIIPDDELAEWKKLSMKNTDVLLVVMTAELESSTLILSNNSGPNFSKKQRDDTPRDAPYTVVSTNSQSQTPANMGNISVYNGVGSSKYESPDVSIYTPMYDVGLSPLDGNNHQTQVPIQTLQPLFEDIKSPDVTAKTSILIDISDECYGIILQVPQPLSNQPRVPLKTAFLVNTGEGVTNNKILEINLLSCQSGTSTTEFVKKLLIQYKGLSSLAEYCGMSTIIRNCGNVEYDDSFENEEDDEDDETLDEKLLVSGYTHEKVDKRKEKQYIQQQYTHFYKMQQRQKRKALKESEKTLEDDDLGHNVIPIHMLAVRKMLDFLTNLKVE